MTFFARICLLGGMVLLVLLAVFRSGASDKLEGELSQSTLNSSSQVWPQLTISLEKKVYAINSPITLKTEVINDSATSIGVWSSQYSSNHFIIIVDDKGHEPTLTKAGAWSKQMFFDSARAKNIRHVIPPRRHFSYPVQDLSQSFQFRPGDYKFQVLHFDPEEGSAFPMLSNVISLQISP